MAHLFGTSISEAEQTELVGRLRHRGSAEATLAAATVKGNAAPRDATQETAIQARDAILRELQAWPGLEDEHPSLAAVRDRLAALQ